MMDEILFAVSHPFFVGADCIRPPRIRPPRIRSSRIATKKLGYAPAELKLID
jgi:hypothetical protein